MPNRTMMIGVVSLLLMSPWAHAQPEPLGASFPLTSGISDVGTLFDIAINADHFVVVWTDEPQLHAQRFDFNGSPIGEQITVDSNNVHSPPHVALRANGDFTIQWPLSGGQELHARSYNADGTPVGYSFVIAEATNVGLSNNDISVTRDGQLISGFVDLDIDAGFIWSLQNAKFAANGQNLLIDSLFSEEDTLRSRLGGDAETGFVQLGERLLTMVGDAEYSAHRLDRDGQPVGGQFPIPAVDLKTDVFCVPDLAVAPDGSFVVTWQGEDENFERQILARAMDGDNLPIGDQRLLNDHFAGTGRPCPSIARERGGTYLVAWGSETAPPGGDDDSGSSISGRLLTADGSPLGDSFQVNDITPGGQGLPIVRTAPNGAEFLVAWYQQGGTHFQLQARLFALALFQDGFETGDTSAWESTTP